MLKNATYLITILVVISSLACEKKKEDASESFREITAPFLTASDFSSTNELTHTQSEITSLMSSWEELWNYKTTSGTNSSTTIDLTSCFSNFKFKSKATDTLYIGGAEDLTSCVSPLITSSGYTLSKFNIQSYAEIKCDGIDLSQFAGRATSKTIGEQIETACGTAPHSFLSNQLIEVTASIKSNGGLNYTDSSISTSAYMNADGTSCHNSFDGTNWIVTNGCTNYEKTHYAANSLTGQTDHDAIKIMASNNLIDSNVDTDPFFVSGGFDLYRGGWQGSITYSGVNNPAVWSMSKDGVTTTGTLNPTLYPFEISTKSGWLRKMKPLF